MRRRSIHHATRVVHDIRVDTNDVRMYVCVCMSKHITTLQAQPTRNNATVRQPTWQIFGVARHWQNDEQHAEATDEEAEPPGAHPARVRRVDPGAEDTMVGVLH